MTKGERIVAEIEANHADGRIAATVEHYWHDIRAALLAWRPVSPLRTILDRAANAGLVVATPDEITEARAELDRLEGK
jgi:hypothetical protein